MGKAPLYRSSEHGAIYTNEVERLMADDDPYFMTPMSDLVEDYYELKDMATCNEELSDYYVYANFMPPGETKTLISFGDITDPKSYYLGQEVVPIRSQDVSLKILNWAYFEFRLCSETKGPRKS